MFFTMVICEVLFMIAALVVQGLVMNRFGETNPDTRRWIMLATMFALPIADKLDGRKAEEELNQSLIIDGLLAIQAGQNPRVIEQMLRNYLPEKKRAVAEG